MSELPLSDFNGSLDPLYTVGQQEHFFEHLVDHNNDHVETQITVMIDKAIHDVHQGREYLRSHKVGYHNDAEVFFDDALQALK